MKPAFTIFTLAIAFGYLIGWATDSRAVETPRHVEYLVKDGKPQPSQMYILARGQLPDRKHWIEAINVSCNATLGWRKCR